MVVPNQEVYGHYRDELEALLDERGRTQSRSYPTWFSYETLAYAGTAVQIAIDQRMGEARRFGTARPFESTDDLRRGASSVALPPEGKSLFVKHKMLETLTSQPSRFEDRLGPILAATNRTLGWAIRNGLIVRPTALLTVTRTIETKYMRRRQTLGAREDGRQDLAAVVGAVPDNGGAALLLATHPQLQEPGDAPADLIAYHERISELDPERVFELDLDPLRMRLDWLYAVWIELLEATGVSIPIVQRAERRFDQPDEGSLTSDQLWPAGEQPHWAEEVDATFPEEAVVMSEWQAESLRGFRYRTRLGDRSLGAPAQFVRDIEKGLPSLMIAPLQGSTPAIRKRLEGADDVVRLEGTLVAPDETAYRPVVVMSQPQTTSIVYLIPAERAALMGAPEWDAALEGLAPIHGDASGRSSDDQGLGISMPRQNALSVSSKDLDKSCNFDAFRCFSHAMDERSHWLPPAPEPDSDGNEEDETRAA